MEHKQFGHLQVQDLFQKGYYTNVYRAFDPSKNNGVEKVREAVGLGETVPPGVISNGKDDDPSRRITTIICVTGPSLLIK